MRNHFSFDKESRALIATGSVDGLSFVANHVATYPCPYRICTHPDTTCRLCAALRYTHLTSLQSKYYEQFRKSDKRNKK